jgi:hypothetical protein
MLWRTHLVQPHRGGFYSEGTPRLIGFTGDARFFIVWGLSMEVGGQWSLLLVIVFIVLLATGRNRVSLLDKLMGWQVHVCVVMCKIQQRSFLMSMLTASAS